jgi:hypothetical protein
VSRQAHEREAPSIDEYESLSCTKRECEYQVLFNPKVSKKNTVCRVADAPDGIFQHRKRKERLKRVIFMPNHKGEERDAPGSGSMGKGSAAA